MSKQHTILVLSLAVLLMVSLVWANEAKEQYSMPMNDIAPNAGPVALYPPMDTIWDLLFEINHTVLTGDIRGVGCEYAGGHFYVTAATSYAGQLQNDVFIYDATGALVDSFDQWTTVTGWGWRDLAYDGTYLYGSDDYVVDCFDLNGVAVPANNFPSPITPARALAYDPATDHFWTQSFGGPIYEFDRTGFVHYTGTSGVTAAYGMAWDDVDPADPRPDRSNWMHYSPVQSSDTYVDGRQLCGTSDWSRNYDSDGWWSCIYRRMDSTVLYDGGNDSGNSE